MKYEIKGGTLPVVICTLDRNETIITESGAMSWMSSNMEMQTSGGGVGKMLGRMFSKESMFQNLYTAKDREGLIAFASSFPGSIQAVEVTPSKPVIVQKSAFLASESSVELSVFFQKKMGAGLFGGEGFVMQKLSGHGIAILEIDGSAVSYDLAAGETMVIDTGYLAMMDASCSLDVQMVKGVKNALFGGEGLFNTIVTGPGHIVLQSMPMGHFASAVAALMPQKSS